METIQHKLKVNEFISIDLNIPKEMSPLDFMAITKMANKICNISGVAEEVMPTQSGEVKLESPNKWTPEMKAYLIEQRRDGIKFSEIARKLNNTHGTNFTEGAVKVQHHYSIHEIPTGKRQTFRYTDEIVAEMIAKKKSGISVPIIAKEINEKYNTNFTINGVFNKFYFLKKAGRV